MKKSLVLFLSIFNAAHFCIAEKKADQKITISGNDTMQFDVKNFEVKAG